MKVSKVATVVSTKRLKNSAMGNPAWEFTFDDGSTHRTSSNVSFSYEVTENNFDGLLVNVYMTRAGRIFDMRKATRLANPAKSGMEFICNRWVFTGRKPASL